MQAARPDHATPPGEAPEIAPVGLDGMLVRFATRFDEAANRAALAFRAAAEAAAWPGVLETAPALTSVYLRFDPAVLPHAALADRLGALLAARDWRAAPLPGGRRLWRIPAAFGGEAGPQFDEAAAAAGLTPAAALEALAAARLRVLTIGFAPGQPYLGQLPPAFDLPRQERLTPRVPVGALCLAVRQIVLFTVASPTDWRQVGRTAFRGFRPATDEPAPLRPGDEVRFEPVSPAELARLAAADPEGGGASASAQP